MVGHEKQWDFFKKKHEQNQLSHAYLFSGQEGIGKKFFAKEFVKLINCLSPGANKACQSCINCNSIEKNNFPDFKIISRKEEKTEIDISQIRDAQNFLSYKSYYGNFKAVIVDNAEEMNQEAQSCFLKTLEEPRGKTILFLITSKADILLPTIASRCQALKFFRPKGLIENAEKVEKEQKILADLSNIMKADFSAKFKYIKSLDLDQQKPVEILAVLQKYFRKQLLNNFLDPSRLNEAGKKAQRALEMSEKINEKLLFTNANPKLALEILLMEL